MNKIERKKAAALGRCRFYPGSWDKRFARDMAWLAEHAPETVLTPAQKWALDAMVYKYRRQLVDSGLAVPEQPPRQADYEDAQQGRRQLAFKLRRGREISPQRGLAL